jgi:hypothetical protein
MGIVLSVLFSTVWLCAAVPSAHAAPCLIVTLTGSISGPPTFNGLAGPERWCSTATTATTVTL